MQRTIFCRCVGVGFGRVVTHAVAEFCGQFIVFGLHGFDELFVERPAYLIALPDIFTHFLQPTHQFVVRVLVDGIVAGKKIFELLQTAVDLADRRLGARFLKCCKRVACTR